MNKFKLKQFYKFLVFTLLAMLNSISSSYAKDENIIKSPFSYTFIEGGWQHRNGGINSGLIDNAFSTRVRAENGNGFFVKGSVALDKNVYFFGAFEKNITNFGIDLSQNDSTTAGIFRTSPHVITAGLGINKSVYKNVDFFVEGGVYSTSFRAGSLRIRNLNTSEQITADLSEQNFTAVSGTIKGGTRILLNKYLELNTAVAWQGARRIQNLEANTLTAVGEFVGSLGIRIHALENISIGLEYRIANVDQALVSFRLQF